MTRADRLGLLLALLAVLAAAIVSERVFERIPHLEDEVAYAWQADAAAHGYLTLPSPPHSNSYLVPFVVDYEGQRFGKYPPGWPAALSLGVRLGARWLVNSLLAGLGVWLTYRLGKKIFSETVGLLAAGLTLTSPFFLMNSGSLLSHPLGLALSGIFALGWLDSLGETSPRRRWLASLASALALGMLILTRPLTALGVCLPFVFHGLYHFVRGDRRTRWQLAAFCGVVLALAALYPLWQYAVTGDPLLNPYTLWWPYDRIGFGEGVGVMTGGNTLVLALQNAATSLWSGMNDLFGWGPLSVIFLPFGYWAARRNGRARLVGSVFWSLVIVYMAYWIGSWLFGPRYYYEGLYSLTIVSAAGMAWLAGRLARRWRVVLAGGIALLVAVNVFIYLPVRLGGMFGLYTIQRANLKPFLTPEGQALTPALVIVHSDRWMFYGNLLALQDSQMTTPFIFAWNTTPGVDELLGQDFPGRGVYHYYPDEPYRFYTGPRP